MGLFFELLSSINHPEMQGNVSELNDVMTTLRRVGHQHGLTPSQTQTLLSALSQPMRAALQEQKFSTEDMSAHFSSEYFDPRDQIHDTDRAIHALFHHDQQAAIREQIVESTGLNPANVDSMLHNLLPTTMRLLNMGQSRQGAEGHNLMLESFLGDGEADLGTVFRMSHRFLDLEFS